MSKVTQLECGSWDSEGLLAQEPLLLGEKGALGHSPKIKWPGSSEKMTGEVKPMHLFTDYIAEVPSRTLGTKDILGLQEEVSVLEASD